MLATMALANYLFPYFSNDPNNIFQNKYCYAFCTLLSGPIVYIMLIVIEHYHLRLFISLFVSRLMS